MRRGRPTRFPRWLLELIAKVTRSANPLISASKMRYTDLSMTGLSANGDWSDNFTVNLLFSPLYTSLVGTLQNFTGDVYTTVTAHRSIERLRAGLPRIAAEIFARLPPDPNRRC
jgi:hypothetical protein